nr:Chain C, HA peptide from 2009 H1N1 pandemic flu virus. [H1N1 subtype]
AMERNAGSGIIISDGGGGSLVPRGS